MCVNTHVVVINNHVSRSKRPGWARNWGLKPSISQWQCSASMKQGYLCRTVPLNYRGGEMIHEHQVTPQTALHRKKWKKDKWFIHLFSSVGNFCKTFSFITGIFMSIWSSISFNETVCFVDTHCSSDRPGRLPLSSANWAFKPNEDILLPLRQAGFYQGSTKSAVKWPDDNS